MGKLISQGVSRSEVVGDARLEGGIDSQIEEVKVTILGHTNIKNDLNCFVIWLINCNLILQIDISCREEKLQRVQGKMLSPKTTWRLETLLRNTRKILTRVRFAVTSTTKQSIYYLIILDLLKENKERFWIQMLKLESKKFWLSFVKFVNHPLYIKKILHWITIAC